MSSPLGHLMQDLAEAMQVTFQSSEGVYSMDMPTPGGRRQVVNATLRESGVGGQMIMFYTPVGPAEQEIDWRSLLEMNVGTIYARVGIIADHIVVVAGQMLDSADLSEVIAMLAEVGTLGDMLEKAFFGEEDRF
jgi:hypothetical protein